MFDFILSEWYRNRGFFNTGVEASEQLGLHGEALNIILPDNNIIITRIDRISNQDDSVRTGPRVALANYFQANYQVGVIIQYLIVNPNQIQIL